MGARLCCCCRGSQAVVHFQFKEGGSSASDVEDDLKRNTSVSSRLSKGDLRNLARHSSEINKDPSIEARRPSDGKDVRKALSLLDGIAGGADIEAIVSFPGIYQEEWNEIVATADLLKRLDPDKAFFSTACIFLPDGDANYGQHIDNDIDKDGQCFCLKLYGEKKEWGCKWFGIWRSQLLEILKRGQKPVVVYKAGQVGQGDEANWDDFPIPFSTNRDGLGGSQAGEVALVKKHVGDRFTKRDVKDVSKAIVERAFWDMNTIIQGANGGQRLAAALGRSQPAQQGLLNLVLDGAHIAEAGATALAKELPKLAALKTLNLTDNAIGKAGAKAVAKELPKVKTLEILDLGRNAVGKAGARAVARVLAQMPALRELGLGGNAINDAGAESLAEALPKMASLQKLWLNDNSIGLVGARALAKALPGMPALQELWLYDNRIGEAGAAELASALPKIQTLQELRLGNNGIGEVGTEALAGILPKLRALRVLELRLNGIGEAGSEALAEALPQMASLRQLLLYDDSIGEEQKALLRKAKPEHLELQL